MDKLLPHHSGQLMIKSSDVCQLLHLNILLGLGFILKFMLGTEPDQRKSHDRSLECDTRGKQDYISSRITEKCMTVGW